MEWKQRFNSFMIKIYKYVRIYGYIFTCSDAKYGLSQLAKFLIMNCIFREVYKRFASGKTFWKLYTSKPSDVSISVKNSWAGRKTVNNQSINQLSKWEHTSIAYKIWARHLVHILCITASGEGKICIQFEHYRTTLMQTLLQSPFELRAHGGCDRSTEDAYSSMAPDPTFTVVGGRVALPGFLLFIFF
jgi:hypothetical protein